MFFPRSTSSLFDTEWLYLPIMLFVKQEPQTNDDLVNLIAGMLNLYWIWENLHIKGTKEFFG